MVTVDFLETGKIAVSFRKSENFKELVGVFKDSFFTFKKDLNLYIGEVRHLFAIEEAILFWDEIDYGENTREDYYDHAFPDYEPELNRIRYSTDTLLYKPLIKEQHEAINFILQRDSALLDSDVGTGKTFMSLGAIVTRFQKGLIGRLVFLTVPSVMYSFREEIFKFTDYFSEDEVDVVLSINKECFDPSKKILIMSHDTYRIISAYYHKKVTKRDARKPKTSHLPLEEWFAGQEGFLVIDEAHKAKNHKSLRYNFIKVSADKYKYKLAMSGTLAPRAFTDYWAYSSILDHDCFYNMSFSEWSKSCYESDKRYSNYGIGEIIEEKQELYKQRLQKMTYNLSKDLLNLPGSVQKDIYIPMPKKLKEIYESVATNTFSKIIQTEEGLTSANVDQGLWTLASVVADPSLLQGKLTDLLHQKSLDTWDMHKDNPKVSYIHEIMKEELEDDPDTKFIIWANNPKVIDQLAVEFEKYNPIAIHGQNTPRGKEKYSWRQEQVKIFKTTKKHQVLIANPSTLGVGLNITEARVVFQFSRPDDFEAVSQSLGRTDRPGMKAVNKIYNLMYIDSYEIAVAEALARKTTTNYLLRETGEKYVSKASLAWLCTGKGKLPLVA